MHVLGYGLTERGAALTRRSPGRAGASAPVATILRAMGDVAADLDELIDAITVDCYGDEEQEVGFVTAMEDALSAPVVVTIVGVPAELVAVDHEDARGLVATCRREGEQHVVSLLDVTVSGTSTFATVAAYRRWSGIDRR